MSIKIALSVYSVDNKYLSTSEKHVLVRLALFGGNDGRNIYPSYEYISRQTGLGRRTVINVINSLIKKGILKKKKRKKENKNDTNLYIIDIEKLKFLKEEGSELNTPGSESSSLGSVLNSLPLVNDVHHPSESVAPKSNLKVKEKVNTHSKSDFVPSVDGVCIFSPHDDLQQEMNTQVANDQHLHDFHKLADLWLKKEGLEDARKIYLQIIPAELSSETLLEAAERKLKSLESNYPHESDRIRYCPQLNNWLEKKSYHDQPHVAEINSVVQLTSAEMKTKTARENSEKMVRNLMKK